MLKINSSSAIFDLPLCKAGSGFFLTADVAHGFDGGGFISCCT